MPRWLHKVLAEIRGHATEHRVRFTYKAARELAFLDLDADDACEILARLGAVDFAERLASDTTREWLYVFKPILAGLVLYVKIAIREDCVLISFHEDSHHG